MLSKKLTWQGNTGEGKHFEIQLVLLVNERAAYKLCSLAGAEPILSEELIRRHAHKVGQLLRFESIGVSTWEIEFDHQANLTQLGMFLEACLHEVIWSEYTPSE